MRLHKENARNLNQAGRFLACFFAFSGRSVGTPFVYYY